MEVRGEYKRRLMIAIIYCFPGIQEKRSSRPVFMGWADLHYLRKTRSLLKGTIILKSRRERDETIT